ncbi:MAG: EamA family transporter [Elusimicrobia bacterium]|nr:EamA family transporter [Elusimicrobiota bacterium]
MTAYTSALLAALAWGIAPIFEKQGLAQVSLPAGLFLRTLGAFFGSLALLAFVPAGDWAALSWPLALRFLIAGVLASVIGQIFAYTAIRISEVSQVTPIMGSWPLIVVLFGWLILKEPMTARKLIGSGLIVTGVWLLRP